MPAIMLEVPSDVARVLGEIDVPGEREKSPAHVTLVYFEKDANVDDVGAAISVIYEVAKNTVPFSIFTRKVTCFPEGEDGVPVIAAVESKDLHTFRNRLCEALDTANIPYSKKFPVFKPHVTLAYAPTKTKLSFAIPQVSWGVHEFVIWGADKGAGELVVKFPLSLPVSNKQARSSLKVYSRATLDHAQILERALVQFSMWRS